MLIQPHIVTKGASVASTAITGNAVAAFSATQQPRLNFLTPVAASASYSALTTIQAKPTTGIVFEANAEAPSLLRVIPMFSNNTATGTGLRVVGWSMYYVDGTTDIWVPTVLAELTTTITTAATKPTITIGTTTYYPHAKIEATASSTPAPNLYSMGTVATETTPASALIDTIGSQLVQVVFKASTGNGSVLWHTI